MDNYDDIINLPHHVSHSHPRMPMIDRAGQFAPFAALTGYDSAIGEAARLTDQFSELSEYDKSKLDATLAELLLSINEHPLVVVHFFKPDKRKTGGDYMTLTAQLKAIDTVNRILTLADGTNIEFDAIAKIQKT